VTIFLIRHAETAANAARIVQTPDVPLNARGVEQSERLARRLADERIALVLSSDYERAAHTARCVATAAGAPLEYEEGLRERHYGDIRGRPYADVGADIFAPDYAPPGGETWDEFRKRVAVAWSRVCARSAKLGRPMAVVTHGLVCRALGEQHLQLPPGTEAPHAFANTSLTVVEAQPPFAVRLLNCAAHLADGSAPARGIAGI
jgi:2,3-bisphosphoglycerate-dependent phosphoglycerate mutase